MRPVPRPQDVAVGTKNCVTPALREVGITPAELAIPAPALPLATPPSSALPRSRAPNVDPLTAVPKLVPTGKAAVPLPGRIQSMTAPLLKAGAADHRGPYPKARHKPPPPIPQERAVVDEPLRPPLAIGEAPASGAPRLVPVSAYVEGQGWVVLYRLVDEPISIR